MRALSEAYETLRGRTNFKLRAFTRHDKNNAKSFRERAQQRSVHQVRSGTAPESPGSVPGPAHGDFWMVPRRSWPAPDAPRSIPGPYFGIPDLSRARSRTSSERPQPPKINLASILAPFSVIFEVFSSNFARAACDECTKSDSQKGVA